MEITEHLILPRLSQCCCDSLSPAPLRACRMGGAAQGCQPSTLGALSPEEPWEMGQPSLGKPSQSTQMIPEPPPKGSDMQGDVYLQLPVGRAPNTLQDPPVCPSSRPTAPDFPGSLPPASLQLCLQEIHCTQPRTKSRGGHWFLNRAWWGLAPSMLLQVHICPHFP